MQGREGDCTEHAVLLASLVRALGIPARVATGIAYAPAFGERRDVFVPHAWVMAWVDGEWRGFDAALPRFGAGHIAFSVGDGDPFRFYGGIELLGSVEVLGIERASAPLTTCRVVLATRCITASTMRRTTSRAVSRVRAGIEDERATNVAAR